jgi:hypothetical protein
MFCRPISHFTNILIILIILAANEVFGQPSPKGFTYVVRNEKGDIMNSSELKKIVVKSINDNEPAMTKNYEDGEMFSYCYSAKYRAREYSQHTVSMCLHPAGTGMSPPAPGIDVYPARVVEELTLVYNGKQMKLVFDIKQHHFTYYLIDSLPFQDGAFRLRSFACKRGGPLPELITTDRGSRCFISADNWVGKD